MSWYNTYPLQLRNIHLHYVRNALRVKHALIKKHALLVYVYLSLNQKGNECRIYPSLSSAPSSNIQAMRLRTTLSLAVALANVDAWPYIGFPIDQQLPQIARIGEDYSFTLNTQTFKSDVSDSITYKAYNLPDWLNFNEDSLNLSGLTTGSDDGVIEFILQGTDSQGSLNQTGQLYVSKDASPYINPTDSIIQQLQSIGETNGYNGIVLQPNDAFKIEFSMDSFLVPSSSPVETLTYYGKSGNRTSLPSWCFFDSTSLTFSGQAPTINSVNAPSLNFDLTLIATDEKGYTAVYQDFSIVVGGHSLILNSTDYQNSVNTSVGEHFEIKLPLTDILLDGKQIGSGEIANVEIYDQPDWVSIDDKSSIVGTVPEDQSSNVILNVTLYDNYGDYILMNFGVDVVHDIFKSQLPDIEAQRGEFLEFQLDKDSFNNLTAVTIEPEFNSDWLRFFHSNNTFVGQTPDNFNSMEIEISASLGSIVETEKFKVIGKGTVSSSRRSSSMSRTASTTSHTGTTKSSSTSTTTTGTSNSSITSGVAVNKSTSNKKALAIGLGVGIPVGVIILILILLIWFGIIPIFKSRRREDPVDEEVDTSYGSGDTGEGGSGTSATIVNNANLEKLESDGYSTGDDEKTFEDAVMYQTPQYSTDQLLNEPKGVFNSWRARDSTNSLATVATNDLLTVNMVETHNARRSQLNIFKGESMQNLKTLNEEVDPQWREFNDKASISKDENSEHSQSGIVESTSTHF